MVAWFLWFPGPARHVPGSWAEDPRIILPPAAVALELVGIAAQRVGLAHIANDPAILRVVDYREGLLRGLAEPIQCGAQVVARQQERGRLQGQFPHRLDRLRGVDHAGL